MAKFIVKQPTPDLKVNPIIDIMQYARGYGVLRDHLHHAHRLAHQVFDTFELSGMELKTHCALAAMMDYLDKAHAIANRSAS